MMRIKCAFLCLLVGWFSSCHSGKRSENVDGVDSLQCYVNPISTGFLGCHVLFHHGMYYCIQGWMSGIYLRAAEDATLLKEKEFKNVWSSADPSVGNIDDAELHYIDSNGMS